MKLIRIDDEIINIGKVDKIRKRESPTGTFLIEFLFYTSDFVDSVSFSGSTTPIQDQSRRDRLFNIITSFLHDEESFFTEINTIDIL